MSRSLIINLRSAASADDDQRCSLLGDAADELERMLERCEVYKGQVWAGSNEIERMRAALLEIREKAATMPNGGAWAAGLANVATLGHEQKSSG